MPILNNREQMERRMAIETAAREAVPAMPTLLARRSRAYIKAAQSSLKKCTGRKTKPRGGRMIVEIRAAYAGFGNKSLPLKTHAVSGKITANGARKSLVSRSNLL